MKPVKTFEDALAVLRGMGFRTEGAVLDHEDDQAIGVGFPAQRAMVFVPKTRERELDGSLN